MKRLTVLAILCIALTLLAGCNFLVKTGTIKGVITDEATGQPVAGAVVTIFNQTVTSDASGQYVANVKRGSFVMKVEHELYDQQTASVTVTADQESVKDFALQYAVVNGVVSDSQGGGPIVGATVTWKDQTVTTDANGQFKLKIQKGAPADLIVTKEGRAMTRVQALDLGTLGKGFYQQLFEIPLRKPGTPYKSSEAPTLVFEVKDESDQFVPVTTGMELTGNVTFKETFESENALQIVYAWVGTMQKNPRELMGYDVEAQWILNSTLHPNGPTYLRTLAYDDNENAVMMIIPVVINNTLNDTAVPGDMAALSVRSYSWGKNLGFLSNKTSAQRVYHLPKITSPDGKVITPNITAEGTNMYNEIAWAAVSGADGYEVYRSVGDDQHYKMIGYSKAASYNDFSTQLKPNTETYYKVVPCNSFGKGGEMVRMAVALPAYNVMLKTPANEAVDVERTPTFTWNVEAYGETFPVGTYFYNDVQIWDATDYQIWEAEPEFEFLNEEDVTNEFSVEYDSILQPGAVYGWDVTISIAQLITEVTTAGYSVAYSFSGEYNYDDAGNFIGTGSANGEAIFTTELQ